MAEAVTLKEFIASMGEVGIETSKKLEDYYIDRILEVLQPDDDGDSFISKQFGVKVGDDLYPLFMVALLSSFRPEIDKINTKFKATVQIGENGDHVMCDHVGLFRKGIEVEVDMTLVARPASEALEQLKVKFNREANLRKGTDNGG